MKEQKFKIGDKVVLVKHSIEVDPKKSQNWTKKASLQKGEVYTITHSKDSPLKPRGSEVTTRSLYLEEGTVQYALARECFKLHKTEVKSSTLTKSDLIDLIEEAYDQGAKDESNGSTGNLIDIYNTWKKKLQNRVK